MVEEKGTKDLQVALDNLKNPRKRAFLVQYADVGTISEATKLVGVDRRTFYNWRDSDTAFASLFEEAKEAFAEKLELELYKRSMTSTDKMSTIALFFALKGLKPEKYREKVTPQVVGNILLQLQIPEYKPEYKGLPLAEIVKIEKPVLAVVGGGEAVSMGGNGDDGAGDK